MQISTFAVSKLNMLQYLMIAKYTSHNNMVTCFSLKAIIVNQKEDKPNAVENTHFFLSVV